MSVIIAFLAGVAAIAGWWLSHQRLGAKPWLEEGVAGELPDSTSPMPTAKVGLGVFLAVVGALFALFISAYSMRAESIDWRSLPVPGVLWFNTAVLIISSGALQSAGIAARRDDGDAVLFGLLAGAVSAVVFLIGQLLAWQQLNAAGYFLAANPANAFFYLLTAVHGLHLLGGLVALERATVKAWRGADLKRLRLSVELCAMYWHFLLLVWLVLLMLLNGWAGDVVAICRQLLT
ncbi:cytochrome c oxidase subunit 3 [soil metagenome]